ncbi:hypothetical protein WJX72_006316 [[Myrmecia] bisecta]|uniref:Uncharacterized protein n=1 Tax=[Myrmecia] bisecta TaxID=41462 RepID=A0AAW1QR73_9CHLO
MPAVLQSPPSENCGKGDQAHDVYGEPGVAGTYAEAQAPCHAQRARILRLLVQRRKVSPAWQAHMLRLRRPIMRNARGSRGCWCRDVRQAGLGRQTCQARAPRQGQRAKGFSR